MVETEMIYYVFQASPLRQKGISESLTGRRQHVGQFGRVYPTSPPPLTPPLIGPDPANQNTLKQPMLIVDPRSGCDMLWAVTLSLSTIFNILFDL